MRTAGWWLVAAVALAVVALVIRVVAWAFYALAAIFVLLAIVTAIRHWRRRESLAGRAGGPPHLR